MHGQAGAVAALMLAAPALADDPAARPAAVAAPAPIPIATFAESPFISRPVLSPDGRSVAAYATVDGKAEILVFPADEPARTQHRFALGKVVPTEVRWAGSNRLLLTTLTSANMFGVTMPVQRLIAVDVQPARARVLDPKSRGIMAGDVLHVDPAGDSVLVASQDGLLSTPSVKRIDLRTDAVTLVEKSRPEVWNWYADEAGVVRAGVAYRGERWTMWYRERADLPLKPIRGRVDKQEEGAVDGIRFAAGADAGVIITNGRTGRFAAYRYDFRTGETGDPLYRNDQVDISGVLTDPRGGGVTGVAYTDDRYRIAWLDPRMRGLQARIDRALPDRENIVLNGSADLRRLLVWSGSASDPGTYYLFDAAKKTLSPMVHSFDKLSTAKHAPVSPVRYAARDGLSIPGYLTLPLGREAKALPLIVLPHGGPHARDTWDFHPWVQFLASRGYAVLQPNFRGSTGYGKAFVERGYGQWGRAMQDDVDDGVDWLVKSGRVDPKRVCIMGASYGGYAALWGAVRNPERYRCAISFAGVTDLRAMLRHDRKSFAAPRYYRQWEEKVRGAEKIDLDAVSPLRQASRVSIPVLIGHGDKDDNVPPAQGRDMVDALKRHGRPVESFFYPDEGHSIEKGGNKQDFYRRVEAFLAKHNPA